MNWKFLKSLRTLFKHGTPEACMQHFSQEYLEKLTAEHKLVSATITHITHNKYPIFVRQHSVDVVTSAVSNLKTRKVELEGMIDILSEYLNG